METRPRAGAARGGGPDGALRVVKRALEAAEDVAAVRDGRALVADGDPCWA